MSCGLFSQCTTAPEDDDVVRVDRQETIPGKRSSEGVQSIATPMNFDGVNKNLALMCEKNKLRSMDGSGEIPIMKALTEGDLGQFLLGSEYNDDCLSSNVIQEDATDERLDAALQVAEEMANTKVSGYDHCEELQFDDEFELSSGTKAGAAASQVGKQWQAEIAAIKPIDEQFPEGKFPRGCDETPYYLKGKDERVTPDRVSDEEKKALDANMEKFWQDYRRSAEAHRQVRKYVKSWIYPFSSPVSMLEICERLETTSRRLIKEQGLEAGLAFPTGCSLNHCAAQYTPNAGDTTVLQYGDVCKIDYGIHVRGRLVESAFTVHFDPKFDPLVEAVREATNAGIKESGIDVRLCDVGETVEEVMTSHEVELEGKTYVVKPIRNLNEHSIAQYRTHGGKIIPIGNGDETKMKEYDIYAIETFGSTGNGHAIASGDMETSHYMKNFEPVEKIPIHLQNSRELMASINKSYGNSSFCTRWLDESFNEMGIPNIMKGLKDIQFKGYIDSYPPLCDVKGSYTGQAKETIVIGATRVEVISGDEDL